MGSSKTNKFPCCYGLGFLPESRKMFLIAGNEVVRYLCLRPLTRSLLSKSDLPLFANRVERSSTSCPETCEARQVPRRQVDCQTAGRLPVHRRRSSMFVFEIGQFRLAHDAMDRLRAEMATCGSPKHQTDVGKRDVRSAVDANLQVG
jgi:hypothetical protein